MGVNAQKVGPLLAQSIRGSLLYDCGCIFWVVQDTAELLALGERCRAGAQKFDDDSRSDRDRGQETKDGKQAMGQKMMFHVKHCSVLSLFKHCLRN
jgi:hypothetical protein